GRTTQAVQTPITPSICLIEDQDRDLHGAGKPVHKGN
ncbi:hypothetical protein ABIB94_009331, partial [Bradyrhizobium sp. JR7.2]